MTSTVASPAANPWIDTAIAWRLESGAIISHSAIMAEALEIEGPPLSAFVMHPTRAMAMSEDEFFEFCQANQELRIERTSGGDIIVMAPEGGSSGIGNSELNFIFQTWARNNGNGTVFGSSAGLILPNGAMRAPDIAWVRNERLDKLTDDQWQKFLPLCPDFVLELRSPTDSMRALRSKMEEYLANGAQLGWLIDPLPREVHVYHPASPVEVLRNPAVVSGEPILPGFTLDLHKLWSAMRLKRTP